MNLFDYAHETIAHLPISRRELLGNDLMSRIDELLKLDEFKNVKKIDVLENRAVLAKKDTTLPFSDDNMMPLPTRTYSFKEGIDTFEFTEHVELFSIMPVMIKVPDKKKIISEAFNSDDVVYYPLLVHPDTFLQKRLIMFSSTPATDANSNINDANIKKEDQEKHFEEVILPQIRKAYFNLEEQDSNMSYEKRILIQCTERSIKTSKKECETVSGHVFK